jgi:hypothetical protein
MLQPVTRGYRGGGSPVKGRLRFPPQSTVFCPESPLDRPRFDAYIPGTIQSSLMT